MPQRSPIRLVVDPSVLLAASDSTKEHPTSVCCRRALEVILAADYHFVLTDAIDHEIRGRPVQRGVRPSRYAMTWLATMQSKRRVYRMAACDDPPLRMAVKALGEAGGFLESRRMDAVQIQACLVAMDEDLLLVEAALATDERILSRDDKVRGWFCLACERIGQLRLILWLNPVKEHETAIEWLQSGAEDRDEFHLKPSR